MKKLQPRKLNQVILGKHKAILSSVKENIIKKVENEVIANYLAAEENKPVVEEKVPTTKKVSKKKETTENNTEENK